jgi:hypothetical protein
VFAGGGPYLTFRICDGVSILSFFRSMGRCARAIIMCPALAYSFPNKEDEIRKAEEQFKNTITNNFLPGCVGVMDSLL